VFSLLVSIAFGYLLGSLPFAYLIVLWKTRVDIRKVGSGNVGTLNSYEVTRSPAVGVAVLVLDLVKGVVSAIVPLFFWGNEFAAAAASGVGAVIGHNFPVWLKWKGGRGLATAAGVMFVLGWIAVALWGLFWGLGFAIFRKVNLGNAVATIGLLIFFLTSPAAWMENLISVPAPISEIRWFGLLFFLPILLRLIEPVKDHLSSSIKKHNES